MQAAGFDSEKFHQEVRTKIQSLVRGMLFSRQVIRAELSDFSSIPLSHLLHTKLIALCENRSLWQDEVIKNLADYLPSFMALEQLVPRDIFAGGEFARF